MKFLVDECVGPTVALWLKQQGYDVVSIYDDLPGIDDHSVLKRALTESRILITCDKDFGEMIFRNKMEHCGIVLLRLIDERTAKKISVLDNIIKNHLHKLIGNFVVASEHIVRITKPFLIKRLN